MSAPERTAASAEPTSALAIETRGLTKRFGSQTAVAGIDLAVPRGSVFGFLGPNGSGKTTSIRMLMGLVAPSSGEAQVLGSDISTGVGDVLPRVGALVEGPAFLPFLSGAANLNRFDTADRWAPSATRRRRIADALDAVGLGAAASKKVHAYSLGMKQRLGLANALLMPRELLVLDEPTNGLDPQGTREVRSLIRSFADGGTTVFVSSHLLAEIEQVCSHAAVLSAGALVAQGRLEELAGEARVRVVTPDAAAASTVLTQLGLTVQTAPADAAAPAATDAGPVVLATVGESGVDLDRVVDRLVEAGVRVRGFALEQPSLEDRFVALTGAGFDVDH